MLLDEKRKIVPGFGFIIIIIKYLSLSTVSFSKNCLTSH